mmetsp:Transcript_12650/g.27269  ORF Transcript_12650/g.27269 Transcript_12650/m.27269 type:complete len:232 (+) Transcript_12650:85-780(+)
MGAGKNKNHRKKRISKHVLEAEQRKKQKEVENQLLAAADRKETGAPSTASPATASNNDTPQQGVADSNGKVVISPASSLKIKDPAEASSYLTLWNYDRKNNTKQWKFNKNTQSWLLRHMYDFDKVSKATSNLLVEYLCEGGARLRSRVEEDAKMRARRYKEWEKKQQQQQGKEEGGDTNEAEGKGVESKEKATQSSEDASWNGLDDHDKRKEYKRARKVLDALKKTEKEVE